MLNLEYICSSHVMHLLAESTIDGDEAAAAENVCLREWCTITPIGSENNNKRGLEECNPHFKNQEFLRT